MPGGVKERGEDKGLRGERGTARRTCGCGREGKLRDVGGGEGDEGAVCRVLGCEREEEENTEGEKRI